MSLPVPPLFDTEFETALAVARSETLFTHFRSHYPEAKTNDGVWFLEVEVDLEDHVHLSIQWWPEGKFGITKLTDDMLYTHRPDALFDKRRRCDQAHR